MARLLPLIKVTKYIYPAPFGTESHAKSKDFLVAIYLSKHSANCPEPANTDSRGNGHLVTYEYASIFTLGNVSVKSYLTVKGGRKPEKAFPKSKARNAMHSYNTQVVLKFFKVLCPYDPPIPRAFRVL